VALTVGERDPVPFQPSAVVLNITATNATGAGFITAFPCGSSRPLASNLNYALGQTVANTVVAGLGDAGAICLFASVITDLVADVEGFLHAPA